MYWLDWCSDVCSSDLARAVDRDARRRQRPDVREPHPLRAGCDNEALDDPASGARGLLDVESSVWVADPHGLPLTPRVIGSASGRECVYGSLNHDSFYK